MRMPVWRISRKTLRAQIVAAEKLLLQQLILFRGKRAGQSVGKARNVLATDQMSKIGKLVQSRPVHGRSSAAQSAG